MSTVLKIKVGDMAFALSDEDKWSGGKQPFLGRLQEAQEKERDRASLAIDPDPAATGMTVAKKVYGDDVTVITQDPPLRIVGAETKTNRRNEQPHHVGTDVIDAMTRDIGNGISKDDTKIPLDAAASALWDRIAHDHRNLPDGHVLHPPNESVMPDYLMHAYPPGSENYKGPDESGD